MSKELFRKSIPNKNKPDVENWLVLNGVKKELANWICENASKEDFKNFKSVFDLIEIILNNYT